MFQINARVALLCTESMYLQSSLQYPRRFVCLMASIDLLEYMYVLVEIYYMYKPESCIKIKPESCIKIKPESCIKIKPESCIKIRPESCIKIRPESCIKIRPESCIKIKPESCIKIRPESCINRNHGTNGGVGIHWYKLPLCKTVALKWRGGGVLLRMLRYCIVTCVCSILLWIKFNDCCACYTLTY